MGGMRRELVVGVCLALIIGGCTKPPPALTSAPTSGPSRIGVVTSIYPLADWVRQIGGDHVDVHPLLKPGSNPHTYEPTPDESILMAQAKVLFCVGLSLEEWVRDIGAAAGSSGPRIVYLSDALRPSEVVAGDPHVWVDPALAAEMVARLTSTLADVDPPHAADYQREGDAYAAKLRKLSDWAVAQLLAVPMKQAVIYHPAFGYLFRRCGIEVLGTIEVSEGREASPSELAGLVATMQRTHSRVIFVEPQFSPKLGQVLANEVGAHLVVVDDIGDPADPQRDTYIHLMEYNIGQIVAALGGKAGPPPNL